MKKKVVWRWDYGVYVPFCPNCDDILYMPAKECSSCKTALEWTEPKYKDTIVTVGDYTVVQATNNHISIYDKDGKFVYHASCRKKITVKELKGMVDFYERIANGSY